MHQQKRNPALERRASKPDLAGSRFHHTANQQIEQAVIANLDDRWRVIDVDLDTGAVISALLLERSNG